MYRYILKRLLWMIPILLGVIFLVFTILSLSPGDPARIILGANASNEAVAQLHEELGLNRPFLVRYVDYIWDLLHGDLGTSYQFGTSVMSDILSKLPNTINIAIGGLLLAIIVGIPLGVLSAVKQNGFLDSSIQFMAMVLGALPSFFVAILLVLIFALILKWFPATSSNDLKSYILPWVAISLARVSSIIRLTRSSMLEVIRSDFTRTARAKGAKESRVLYRHCLQNALLPVVTTIGMSLSAMIAGSVVIEAVFSVNGIGSYLVEAVRSKDIPIVLGTVVCISITTAAANLLVDILYGFIDPRIKATYKR